MEEPSQMSGLPRVSVLMLTYNRPKMIGRAIASLAAQSCQDWELVIVQDGDNPETERLVGEWTAQDSRIFFFRRSVVGSIAEASNFGLEKMRGEYVAILDDDDYWAMPGKLDRQVEFLDAHPDHVAVGGGYIVIDEHGAERGRYVKPETDIEIRRGALKANPVANSTAMFRRVIGGQPARYDASMRQFADWDFWLAVGAQGKLHNFREYLAYYAMWEGGSSFKHQKANAQAALRIVEKHRARYGGYASAYTLAALYLGYAYLPERVRRVSNSSLSALKKSLTGSRPAAS